MSLNGVGMKSLFIFTLLTSYSGLNGQSYFEYDSELKGIYQSITDLKLNASKKDLLKYQSRNASNLATYHLLSYVDFFTLFINEDANVYESLYKNRDLYLDKIYAGPSNNPEKRFINAEILLQWALIDLKFDNKLRAGKAIYDAYNLLEDNKKAYPSYINNYKSLSIIHVLAESVPSWVRTILGIKGSLSTGQSEISKLKEYALSNPNYLFRSEVAAINSYILFYQLNKKEKAIADLKKFKLDHTKSPIVAFLKASMALRSGDNESCLNYLEQSPKGPQYANFYYLDFMLGRSKLYKLDPIADKYMLRYVQNFKGKHFIKEAYQKLAWHALVVKGDPALYQRYMKKCMTYGEALLDEDKQALKEAKKNVTPNKILLSARIQFDGGYFHQAFQTLTLNKYRFTNDKDGQIEFNYRLGRIFQSLHNPQDALTHFSKTLDLGKNDESYFACSAALQMATIYENLTDKHSAMLYYKICLDLEPSEYAITLHQKAKSGLDRL